MATNVGDVNLVCWEAILCGSAAAP